MLKKIGCACCVLLALLVIVGTLAPRSRRAPENPAPVAEKAKPAEKTARKGKPAETTGLSADESKALLESYAAVGSVVRVEQRRQAVYVARGFWRRATPDQKRTLGYVSARYCGGWAELFDAPSGKRLAKYSEFFGWTVDD